MSAPTLRLRPTLVLCAFALLLTGICALVLHPRGTFPGAGLIDPALLPHFLTAAALLFAALGAPGLFPPFPTEGEGWGEGENSRWAFAGRAGLAALWCGVIAGYMLLVAARISPIANIGILGAAVWVAGLCWIAILLNAAYPRASYGIVFAWCVVPPVLAYLFAELYLSSPLGAGFAQAPRAAPLREVLRWLLNASPGTAAFGALNGGLPGGVQYSPVIGYSTMCVAGVLSFFSVPVRT